MKKNRIFCMVACCLGVLCLLAVGLTIQKQLQIQEDWELLKTNQISRNKKYVYTWEEELTGISIQWVHGPVTVMPTEAEGYTVEIMEMSDRPLDVREKASLSSSGGVLEIKWNKDILPTAWMQNYYKGLVVKIPQSIAEQLEEIRCSTYDGDLSVADFQAEDISVSSLSGTVNVDTIQCQSFSASVTSGNLQLKDVTCTESDITTVSGGVSAEHFSSGEGRFSTLSGGIHASGEVGQLKVESISGVFSGEFIECPETAVLESVSGDLQLFVPKKDCNVKYETISGSFQSDFTSQPMGNSGHFLEGAGENSISFISTSGKLSLFSKSTLM